MPHVVIKLWPGRSEEQKTAMVHAVVEAAEKTLGAAPQWLSVSVEEVAPEIWEEQVVQPGITGKADTLYFHQGEYLK